MEEKNENTNPFHFISLNNIRKKLNIKYVFILLSVGILLMIIGSVINSPEEPTNLPAFQTNENDEEEGDAEAAFTSSNKQKDASTMTEYEALYEEQLEKALEQIIGVSDVSVVVNLAESEETVFEKNENIKEQMTEETDREGGTRGVQDKTRESEVVIIRNGDKEEPLIKKTEKPNIRGVLIVARGVENVEVKSWVVEAVSRVLDVPPHRVSVLPKKSKGE